MLCYSIALTHKTQSSTHAKHGGVAHGSGTSMLHTRAKSIFPTRDSQSLTPIESTRSPSARASARFDAFRVLCCETSHLGPPKVRGVPLIGCGYDACPPPPKLPTPTVAAPSPVDTYMYNTHKADSP